MGWLYSPWCFDFDLNTSSERPISKLSENHKINVIGPTKLKLWLFKDALFIEVVIIIISASVGKSLLLTQYTYSHS